MIEPRDKFVDQEGLKLHYLEWGVPVAEPFVLVHGFLDQAHSWTRFVAAIQKQTREPLWIVAPDCRGHGDSAWVGAGGYYHFPDYVRDLDCIIRELGAQTIKLIGHSMGGTISLLYAGTFPARVSKLILIEGIGPVGMNFSEAPTRMERWITETHQRGRHHFREYSTIEAGARQLQQTNPRLDSELALDLARAGMKQSSRGKWIWKFDPLHRTTSPQPFYSAQAIEFLRRIECPVLIIDGKESRHSQRPDKEQRLEMLRSKYFAEIESAGHMVHQDNPQALAHAVAEFVSR